MTAPTKGVEIKLDKPRHLRYPLGVLREMDEQADLAKVIWLGLKHEDSELTEEAVGEMVDMAMLPELADPIKKATGGMIALDRMLGIQNGTGDDAGNE